MKRNTTEVSIIKGSGSNLHQGIEVIRKVVLSFFLLRSKVFFVCSVMKKIRGMHHENK